MSLHSLLQPLPSIVMQGITPVDEKENPHADSREGNSLHDPRMEASQCGARVSQDSDEDKTEDDIIYVKGEPVIRTGSDVSHFLVDVRDDGDPALTFRSLSIGTIFACLGAALCQARVFRNT